MPADRVMKEHEMKLATSVDLNFGGGFGDFGGFGGGRARFSNSGSENMTKDA
jgi:hypothetical protein